MFIQSVVSKAGRVVVSADQLRVVIRCRRRLAVARRDAGVRARLRADFGGYLVSERGAASAFSARRGAYVPELLPECVTGAGGVGFCCELAGDVSGGPLDAPYALPAGSMRSADFGGFGGVVQRSAIWRDAAAARYAKKYADKAARVASQKIWRDSESGRVVLLLATESRVHGLVGGDGVRAERVPCMDAPDYLPAGSVRRYEPLIEVCAAQRGVFRAGWYE